MKPKEKKRALALTAALTDYQKNNAIILPGIIPAGYQDCLARQIIDSLRRVEFANHLTRAQHHPDRMDPSSSIFDPLRAAVTHLRKGQIDEAWWLVFLATHFGKHHKDGWQLVRDIYGRLGQGGLWDWKTISQNPGGFRVWLKANICTLKSAPPTRRFSNHRKYETLNPDSQKGTAAVIESYVKWVSAFGSHSNLVRSTQALAGQNPEEVFAALYKSMNSVQRFGRLGKFDFLAMLGKLGIAPISPGSAFLVGATGPLAGTRLLFFGDAAHPASASLLDIKLKKLGQETGLGMQVLEDALCNWQKSPGVFKRFRG